jgi:hypothetical protein
VLQIVGLLFGVIKLDRGHHFATSAFTRLRRLPFARESLHPEIGDPRAHCRVGERFHGRRIELGDDISLRALGCEKTVLE